MSYSMLLQLLLERRISKATGRVKPTSMTIMIAPVPLQELEQLTKLEREQELLPESAHMDMIHVEEGSS